jgi:two-component system phosphate regulon sensor histidine kinase PhoR
VKYSPHGGDIRVGAAREERDGGDWAVLTVSDWGLGIPESELGRVFEPYYRGTNVAGTTSGTGVGLAGTRHIVEQHGGEIEVESAPGAATTFTVRLPLIRDEVDLADL